MPMRPRRLRRPGSTFTKRIEQRRNKGDLVQFRVAEGGKPFPIKVLRDVGLPSTLRDNPGVDFPRVKRRNG